MPTLDAQEDGRVWTDEVYVDGDRHVTRQNTTEKQGTTRYEEEQLQHYVLGNHELKPSESQPVTTPERRFRHATVVDERSVCAPEVLNGELGLGGLKTTVYPRK